ncbi:ATP-dependent DNA helicase [soil metagenome]
MRVESPQATSRRIDLRLDERQQGVVDHDVGPLLALGGPGTGKSTVLEERFLSLALGGSSTADRILFLVANRAHKMRLQDRLTRRLLVDEGLQALVEVPVYTWHGLAYHLVSRHYDRLGYPEPPVLLTSPEQWGDIREALAGEPPTSWPTYAHLLRSPGFADEVVDFCLRAEQRLLDESDLQALVRARPEYAEIVRFFTEHRARLRSSARMDYPTLVADATKLIANDQDVRRQLRRRFSHILVDDGQELAPVQQRLLRFLTGFTEGPAEGDGRSLVVAADPDSAIETFRGAEPGWLGSFAARLGDHDTVRLATSYRMGPDAGLMLTRFVGAGSESAHRPTDFAGRSSIEVRQLHNLAAEVATVGAELRRAHLAEGIPYEEMAILPTPPGAMLPPLERALSGLEVPYSVAVPDRPLEQEPAVRSFRVLARLALHEAPDDDVVRDALRSGFSGLEDHEVRDVERGARAERRPLAAFVASPSGRLPEGIAAKIADLRVLSDILRAHADSPADAAFYAVWQSAGVFRRLEQRAAAGDDMANRDLDALVAYSRSLGRFVERRRGRGTLGEYLPAVGRADFGADPWLPPERSGSGVKILSFHAAKGRQFELVCVAGCVEGAIPKGRRARGLFDPYFLDEDNPVERAERNEMEDRRVFYVALTRSTGRTIVTTSPGASRHKQPSRYLVDLFGELPRRQSAPDLGPLAFSELAATLRRSLADVEQGAPERIAALVALGQICESDPACLAARPDEWWWRWDWTDGAPSIRAQQGDDEELPPDKLRTSYSRISKYENCGLQYVLSQALGLDPESSHQMAFGTWIHQIFEDIEKDPGPEQQRSGRRRLESPAAIMTRYEELFDESIFPNQAIARQFRRDGLKMLENYWERLRKRRVLEVEHRFKVDFDGHLISGRIDRVDKAGKNILVSDYKTSRYTAGWQEARESLQLAIYYLACKQDPVIAQHGEPAAMQLVYPFKLYKDEVAVRCQKPEEAEAALAKLPKMIEGVLEEDFRPKPEADCFFCKFKPLCPLWVEGRELQP